jgi:hypothetical protein
MLIRLSAATAETIQRQAYQGAAPIAGKMPPAAGAAEQIADGGVP